MITVLKKSGLLCVILLATFAQSVVAEDLRIIGEDKSFVATLPSGSYYRRLFLFPFFLLLFGARGS